MLFMIMVFIIATEGKLDTKHFLKKENTRLIDVLLLFVLFLLTSNNLTPE